LHTSEHFNKHQSLNYGDREAQTNPLELRVNVQYSSQNFIHQEVTMKAAILHSHSAPLSVEDVDLPPAPGAGEAVVEVLTAPVASYAHEVFRAERPAIPNSKS
jgi:hypothetical protein